MPLNDTSQHENSTHPFAAHGPSLVGPAREAADQPTEFQCPLCPRNDFQSGQELGRHKRTAHGVVGTSRTSLKRHRREERLAREHSPLSTDSQPPSGKAPEAPVAGSPERDHVSYARGFIESFFDGYGRQHKVSPKDLTRAVLRAIMTSE